MTSNPESGMDTESRARSLDDLCARLERLTSAELLALRDAALAVPREESDRAHTVALGAAWKADRLADWYTAGERASFAVMRSIAAAIVDWTAERVVSLRSAEADAEAVAGAIAACKHESDDVVQIVVEAATHAAHAVVTADLIAAEAAATLQRPLAAVRM